MILPRLKKFERGLIFLGDGLLLYLAWKTAYLLRFNVDFFRMVSLYPQDPGPQPWELYRQMMAMTLPMWLIFLYKFSNLASPRVSISYFRIVVEISKAVILTSLAMLAGSFMAKHSYSRMVVIFFSAIAVIYLSIFRTLLGFVFRKFYSSTEDLRVAVVGNGKVPGLIQRILSQSSSGVAKGYNFPISSENLLAEVQKNRIREVIFSPHPHGMLAMAPLIEDCQREGVECKVVPDLLEFRMGEMVLDQSLGLPLFHLKSRSLDGFDYAFKRFFDLALSLLILGVLAVPLIIIALILKLDSRGPVFYFQNRVGYRGRTFLIWKFRTMVMDAENRLQELLDKNERPGVAFKMAKDPRVTRVGRFLRRWSLDEVPQLINVLKGDMSLVGPRPQIAREVETYDAAARRRLSMLPGITGLWQVRGRANLSQEDMIVLDLYYLENWSLALDLEILLRTVPAVLHGRGAY